MATKDETCRGNEALNTELNLALSLNLPPAEQDTLLLIIRRGGLDLVTRALSFLLAYNEVESRESGQGSVPPLREFLADNYNSDAVRKEDFQDVILEIQSVNRRINKLTRIHRIVDKKLRAATKGNVEELMSSCSEEESE
ncbi:uncharacterized protein LOC113470605 [Diaphorina citri]|uniref:Uncharacterized protein LOC113470605 n=1 Tax=Diaphorina citri TaxID=121845 RepID=A0A3Q0J958_DIACI|nr:uncharacterized protein LOC113470605 [Diaphorina citri]KAI5698986.1 hypothetical protein M8J75_014820 [Diaphorina citri]